MTRAEAEAELLEVASPGMGKVGLSTTSAVDGFVASLNTAIRAGFAAIGIRPAVRIVSDVDFASVPEADEDKLLAVAKLSILDLILDRWMKPDERQNTTSQSWGGLYEQLIKRADRLRGEIVAMGIGVPTLGIGLISLGILEPADEGAES